MHHGDGACDSVLGLGSGPQLGCALTYRFIGGGVFDGVREALNRQPLAGNGFRSHPQLRDALPPEELIAKEGDNDRRNPGVEAGGGCPGATVMYDSRGLEEEPRNPCVLTSVSKF
jgi:hypothetical protein